MNKFIVTMIAACSALSLSLLSLTGIAQANMQAGPARQAPIQQAVFNLDRAPASLLHQAQYYPERRHYRERDGYPRRDYNHRHYRPHYQRPYRYEHRPYYRPYYEPAPPRYYRQRPHRVGRNAHVNWCLNRYRSYRPYDNTFQPNHGPRRQCISPFI